MRIIEYLCISGILFYLIVKYIFKEYYVGQTEIYLNYLLIVCVILGVSVDIYRHRKNKKK